MTTILFFLIFFGIVFPKQVKALLNTILSIIGKILSPLTEGFIKVIGAILKKIIQIIADFLNWILKVIVMFFDKIRF